MEKINEAYSTNFKFSELDNLSEFEEKVEYCREKLGPDFGQGSSRIVFDFTDSAVLKLAYNEKGIAQNRAECEMSKKYPIVAKIFKAGKNYSWILSENVLPCREADFDECLGYSWDEIQEFVTTCYNEYGTEHCPCYPMEYDDFDFCLNKSSHADWFNGLREYMSSEKIPYGDMIRLSTYGLVKRNGEMVVVILDAGLTQEILNTHYRNKANMENNELQEEVSVEPFEPKDELNPKFWVNNKLNSKVRMRLLDIADDFVKTLNIRWVKPDDIVLTGSIANYNWTKFSDVDIHIIMDYSKVYKKTDFVKSYFDAKKEEWNGSHDGLKIYGFNVELSVEDKNTPAVSSGVYSLEKNDWVSEPKDLSDAKLNKEYVESTAETYIDKIDDLDRRIRKERDAKKVETLSNKMVSIFNKLKGMRKEGLKSKSKEMSSGNIIWKILRAEGYIKKIWDIVNYNYDRSMSLNEGYWGHLPLQNDYVLDDLHELADENITPLVKELEKEYKNALKKDATPKKEIYRITSTDEDGNAQKEDSESMTSERYESLQEIFHLTNKILYLIWSAAEWGPKKLEKEGIDVKKLLNNCIDLLDDDVWIEGWKDGKKEERKYLKNLKHWVELLIDRPYDKGKERYDQIKMGKELGFLHELDEAVTGKDNKNAAALYVYALDKPNGTWHILCAKRSNREGDEEGGKWNPPMGHLHRGEDMVDGAIRECIEESGVDFKAYHKKIKFMDGHRWGNNYRLIIKDKFTKDFTPGEGDEENDKFIWLPVEDINKKEWAWSCEENAEKYIPKTVTLNESQYKLIQESVVNETITLYHGVMTDKLEYNLENGGFTPRVCSEGGPKAVYLSEKQYPYEFTFEFKIPKALLNKKLFQMSTVDYIYTDFISFNEFECSLVKTCFYEHGKGFALEINLEEPEISKRNIRWMPEQFEHLSERMKNYPMVYEKYIEPFLEKIGFFDVSLNETKTIILREEQLEGVYKRK